MKFIKLLSISPKISLDYFSGLLERRKYCRSKLKYPPLFIVGAPRSGTTIVMQHLLNNYCFSYIPNVSNKHFYAPIRYIKHTKNRNDYNISSENSYGVIGGLMAPSDGWNIFNRFFFIYKDDVLKKNNLTLLNQIICTIEEIFSLPFINKNNANSNRIPYLKRMFPDAIFIHVERDIVPTVNSLLKARKKNNVPESKWWGISPIGYENSIFNNELERCVIQTYCVNKYIDKCLSEIQDKYTIHLQFEDFLVDSGYILKLVYEKYKELGIVLTERDEIGKLHIKPPSDISEGLSEKIKYIIQFKLNEY